ncbi:AraC family transcriptional regulator [Chryseobacterium sp.]|uniref:GlxA family transcriptional regulator n=1 Tax=Chryseobacterium sp. TaxID=1871047 RepID=UPI0025B911CF|nr:AraC family transcriptional regulator [Chryseobacterium sp.]
MQILPYVCKQYIFIANLNMENKVKHIVIWVSPSPTILSVAGPLEIFARAIDMINKSNTDFGFQYELHVISSSENKEIKSSSGLCIVTEGNFRTINYPIDTLIIAGLSSTSDLHISTETLEWIRDQSQRVKRIASVCTGAYFLAETGILNGKKVTTHWQHCKALAERYPKIEVEIAPYFIKDGNVYTSAGISSGMDLSLLLIEEDLGRNFALQIANGWSYS